LAALGLTALYNVDATRTDFSIGLQLIESLLAVGLGSCSSRWRAVGGALRDEVEQERAIRRLIATGLAVWSRPAPARALRCDASASVLPSRCRIGDGEAAGRADLHRLRLGAPRWTTSRSTCAVRWSKSVKVAVVPPGTSITRS
jgi:hypothetical protein